MKKAKEVEGKLGEVVKIKGDIERMIEESIKKNVKGVRDYLDENRKSDMQGIAEIVANQMRAQEERQREERKGKDEEIMKFLRETRADNMQIKERKRYLSDEITRDRAARVEVEKMLDFNIIKNEERMRRLEEEVDKMKWEMKRIGEGNGNDRVKNLEKRFSKSGRRNKKERARVSKVRR